MNARKDLSHQLESIRERLGDAQGKRYWRSLEELADTDAFRELLANEFPDQASEWDDSLSRRRFLTLMGASLALAGLSGCSTKPAPAVKLVPYVRAPEEILPGKPLFYATAMTLGGDTIGLLAESHLGRPTKIEGNPDHPASLGATDAFAQASVLTLYDPDRSQTVTHLGQTRTWDEAFATLRSFLAKRRGKRGAGLRILTEPVRSPTLADQMQVFLKAFPEARWHQYEPVGHGAERAGARLVFGQEVHTYYRFDRAARILSLDADFMTWRPGKLRYIHDFMNRRRVRADQPEMNRLYVVESTPSITGAKADHRLTMPAGAVEGYARALASKLGIGQGQVPAGVPARWIDAVAEDLRQHAGAAIVLAGLQQPPAVHALALAMNHALGNAGKTVIHTDAPEAWPLDPIQSLRELVQDMNAGRVEGLVILGGNPVFTAPADFHFTEALANLSKKREAFTAHLSLYQDETSRQCQWHLPEAHPLETWSDTRAYEGTAAITQPLIAPLYGGRSGHEILGLLTHERELPGYEIVRDHWRRHWTGRKDHSGNFEDFWETALHDGVVAGTALAARTIAPKDGWADQPEARGQAQETQLSLENMEINFRPDPTLYDGCFANNGWLQELPKPLTKLTWDNAVLLSPATAQELGLENRLGWSGGSHGQINVDLVQLRYQGQTLQAPVWIMPGHPDHCATVHLGHGRTFAGKVGTGTGFNAYALRTSAAPWFDTGLTMAKTGRRFDLACTQYHHLMNGTAHSTLEERQPVRAATLEHFRKDPHFAGEKEAEHEKEETAVARKPLTLYPGGWEEEYQKHYRWAMAIDLTACVGCNACVAACQSENNIPVVGKEQVLRGREMHWIRIDRYYYGTPEDAQTYFQPVPCMHCENAPCELVCPVGATVHSAEGLNDMVYNRCVGTRYCSNNCPYKVRRFNFLQFNDYATESLKLQRNPDVTVRSRGVMEKCSYCVQRLRHAEIDAEKERRRVRDGEVLTACQAACPAEAISFGNLNDPHSQVARWKAEPLNYALLANLNTLPRTTYLAALRNPNPAFETA